jgi:hypothetical protein
MKLNRLGNWAKEVRITVRLPTSVRDEITAAAIEDRCSRAETVGRVLTQWCVLREIERNKAAS